MTTTDEMLEAMKSIEALVPAIANHVRIVVDRDMKPDAQPLLICSKEYAKVLGNASSETCVHGYPRCIHCDFGPSGRQQ